MKHYRFTSAFSMLELVFVIVILGIVASIGSEMIVKVYESYIVQRAEHRATLKTELAATQIANRLSSAISGTVYRIKSGGNYESIETALTGSGDDYIGLQWVSQDTDSFSTASTPGWSGFCDINISSQTSIETPGSALGTTTTIITNLSGSAPTPGSLSLYFPYDLTEYKATITDLDQDTITLTGTGATRIAEHYKLAWSSYALIVEGGDLYLYYNFDPTPATPVGTTRSLLMKNISTFKFMGAGRTIRFKICKQEPISADVNITACKEKAVF